MAAVDHAQHRRMAIAMFRYFSSGDLASLTELVRDQEFNGTLVANQLCAFLSAALQDAGVEPVAWCDIAMSVAAAAHDGIDVDELRQMLELPPDGEQGKPW